MLNPPPQNSSRTDYTHSERLVSSSILNEEYINQPPEDSVVYVEVPVIEEVIRHVPRREIVEVEKRVPRYEYEWTERIVEVPQIQYVDKYVEVPHIQEVVRTVPVRQVVEVPREVIRHVPKIETRIVEKEIEVPGEIIEIPKPYLVENKIVVPRFVDREVATVVAQRFMPIITESETEVIEVELKEYNPYMVPVDVYVPRPVARNLIATSKIEEHRVVDVPPAHFNALVKQMNTQLTSEREFEGLLVTVNGTVPVSTGITVVPPSTRVWETQHVKGTHHWSHTAPSGNFSVASTTSYVGQGLSSSPYPIAANRSSSSPTKTQTSYIHNQSRYQATPQQQLQAQLQQQLQLQLQHQLLQAQAGRQ